MDGRLPSEAFPLAWSISSTWATIVDPPNLPVAYRSNILAAGHRMSCDKTLPLGDRHGLSSCNYRVGFIIGRRRSLLAGCCEPPVAPSQGPVAAHSAMSRRAIAAAYWLFDPPVTAGEAPLELDRWRPRQPSACRGFDGPLTNHFWDSTDDWHGQQLGGGRLIGGCDITGGR